MDRVQLPEGQEPLRGENLLVTTKSPRLPGAPLIEHGNMGG